MQKYTLPASWSSALVNDQWEGYEEKEATAIRKWLDTNRPGRCVGCSDPQYFARSHDAMDVSPSGDYVLEYDFV
ncbi:hypothetical protein [Diaphorobacter sp. J5-51]|uniref:hypothetical protein n=1 Tax=Diaphorobacter sp. J5-51 TaxID=680496 RepID=UPI0012F9EC27|nr:hypothetical protein [Diaphorobacter sp. J5-51]